MKTTCLLTVSLTAFVPVQAATINVPADQPTIQDGIDAAANGDVVLVAAGTYDEIIDFNGKPITVRSGGGPDVTIIDATSVPDPGTGKPVVRCVNGEGPDTILDGFTITGGTGDTSVHGGGGSTRGGGMLNVGSSPTVTNCVFTGNAVAGVQGLGGGMQNSGAANPKVTNCLFSQNTADYGAGMFNQNSSPLMTNCTFSGNTANNDGGGMFNDNSAPTAINCIFWANADAGGMDESAQIFTFTGTPTVSSSDVQGGWTGTGANNINADPLFATGPKGDFYLSQLAAGQGGDSPCVNAGCGLVADRYLAGTTRTDEVEDLGAVDMGFHYNAQIGAATVRPDLDLDGDVDGLDFLTLSNCFNGSLNPPRPQCLTCRADIDLDGDVDGDDFLTLSNCFNGALNPPNCP